MDKSRLRTVETVVSQVHERPVVRDACLVVVCGAELGRKYSLEKSTIVLGRTSKADIQLDQQSVSRNHAKIINTGKTLLIRDLGSTNGTFVNDQRITESELRDRDQVQVGRTIFKFLTGSNIESAYHEEIYRLTTIDGLTQVYNKRYFLDTLDREYSRAARHQRELALVMLDIDHFKQVNDTHGHLAGDGVLKHVSTIVRSNIRRDDVFARFGGEEFAIICPEVSHQGALTLADKLVRLVAGAPFTFNDKQIDVRISAGVASVGAEAEETADHFLARADSKLYEAKRSGRNQACG